MANGTSRFGTGITDQTQTFGGAKEFTGAQTIGDNTAVNLGALLTVNSLAATGEEGIHVRSYVPNLTLTDRSTNASGIQFEVNGDITSIKGYHNTSGLNSDPSYADYSVDLGQINNTFGQWVIGSSTAVNHIVEGGSTNSGTLTVYQLSATIANDVLKVNSNVGGTNVIKWRVEGDGDTISATGSYTSDIRVKKDVEPIHYGLDEIMQLSPMSFRWKHEGSEEVKSFSIDSAQNVEAIMPEMVRDDGLEFEDEEGNKFQAKAVYEKELVAVMVKAIQEQQELIESLKTRIETLENQ